MRENYTLTRLYIDVALRDGEIVELPNAQAHYLGNVLRKAVGDSVRVFNGESGRHL